MPTYMYKCRACDYEFEKRQRMSEDPLIHCPDCGEPELRKVVNSVGVVFKGSGFYVTDNRNGSSKASNGSSKTEAADSDKKPESTTNSKDTGSTETVKSSPASEKAVAPAT